jgi:hypothetical protein
VSGVGGAIAAAIVLAVSFGPTHVSTVKAETIFQELQNALGQAFKITFENLVSDGVRSDGTLIVLDNPAPAGGGSPTRPHGMYMEARLQGEEGTPNAGLDVNATLSFVGEDNDWAYVKTQNVPAGLTDGNPVFGWLANLAGDGLLVELPDGPVTSTTTTNTPDPATPPSTTSSTTTFGGITTTVTESTQTSVTMRPTMTFSVGVSNTSDGAPTQEQLQQMTQQALANAQNGSSSSGVSLMVTSDDDDDEMGAVINKLITGQATPADFQQLVTALQSSADSVIVEQVEPGVHVLTATGLDVESEGGGNVPGGATLTISYRENDGVQWAEVQHIGDSEGRVRFERENVQPDDPRFDRERFASDPAVRRLDLSDWTSLFSVAAGQGTPPATP